MSDFSIEDYDFEGLFVECSVDIDGDLEFYDEWRGHKWHLTRQDIIAMAKHFKITEKEIEEFK